MFAGLLFDCFSIPASPFNVYTHIKFDLTFVYFRFRRGAGEGVWTYAFGPNSCTLVLAHDGMRRNAHAVLLVLCF